jgi:hypothetical protein
MRNKIAKSISSGADRKQYARTGSTAYAPLQEPKLKMTKRQRRLQKPNWLRGIDLLLVLKRNCDSTYWQHRLSLHLKVHANEIASRTNAV